MESILPSPGTTSPRFTFKMPLGPSRAAIPFVTSRTVHPSIVVGLVSGTGVRLVPLSVSFPLTRIELVFRCEPDECPIIGEPAKADAPCDSFGRLLVDEERCSEPASALASTKASRTPLPSGSIGSPLESGIVADDAIWTAELDGRWLGLSELLTIHARPNNAITPTTISPARISKLS